MAALWWHRQVRQLGETPGIEGVKSLIADLMSVHLGFTDVHINSLEVAGGKLGVWASIAHFEILPEVRYWEVIMTAGDDNDTTRAVNDEIRSAIATLQFPGGSTSDG